MAEVSTGVPAAKRTGPALLRFDLAERAVHWLNAALFGILIVTGAALLFGPLTALVGRRELVERIHLYAGLALPAPMLVAVLLRRSQLGADLRRLNRWTPADRRWLGAASRPAPERHARRSGLAVGKFNAGQKLNAAFTAGAGLVMLGTGVILRWYRPFPLAWREGATAVHNWLFLLIAVVIAGHILYALADVEALRSMVTGRISRSWARRHAPAWLAEIERTEASRRSRG